MDPLFGFIELHRRAHLTQQTLAKSITSSLPSNNAIIQLWKQRPGHCKQKQTSPCQSSASISFENQLYPGLNNIYTETLIDASKEVGLQRNVEKTKYMLLSHQQNVGQNQDIKIANRFFQIVSQFKYLGTTGTSQNLI
jgi:hypothetical protein